MISVINGNKSYPYKKALNGVNLEVEEGSIFGLIGPNGAGKTTLIKCILDIYKLDSGEIKIGGENIRNNPEAKALIGYVADENKYFTTFSIDEMIKLYKMTYKSFDMDRFNELNSIFKLPEDRSIGRLSKGMKMRLSLMLNLSIRPKVLIMDEPTSGLDPIARKNLIQILLDEVAERRTTILISSHNLGELERICDTVAIMNEGEIKYRDSLENMKTSMKKVQIAFKEEPKIKIEEMKEFLEVEKIGRAYTILTKEFNQQLISKLEKEGMVFYQEINLTLEDIFMCCVEKGTGVTR
ncbi:MAG: ABC transporter ATP-binding protein [Bacillota bacterium]|nr:ABC transporter ATP-binding protein [Bacillota bacterium]